MIFLDYSEDYQMLFQDPASPMMNGIIDLHHYVMFFLFVILVFVVVALTSTLDMFLLNQTITNLSFYVFHFGRDMYVFLNSKDRHRHKILVKLYKRYDVTNFDTFIQKKRKLSLASQWNNHWSNLYSLLNLSSTDVSLSKNRFSLVSFLPAKKNLITSNVDFLTIDDKKVLGTDLSSYIVNLFLRKKQYDRLLPSYSVQKTAFFIRTRTLEAFCVVNVYYTYAKNLFYSAQMLYTLRSGVQNFTHSTTVEIVWTVVPSLVLVFIGIPSFILLYAMDEIIEPEIVVKCIGHQWYWSYEIGHRYIDMNYRSFEEISGSDFNVFDENGLNTFDATLPVEFKSSTLLEVLDNFFLDICSESYIMGLTSQHYDMYAKRIISPITSQYFSSLENDEKYYSFDMSFLKFYRKVGLERRMFESADNFYHHVSWDFEENVNNSEADIDYLFKSIPYLEKTNKDFNAKYNVANFDNLVGKWRYINFNSYMVPEDELKEGQLRLLEVDNALYLPVKTHIDLMVTANDVIHCWTVPSFGVKMDAVPGRINHTNIFVEREGVFYGQCSEICGVNHGFMPIKVVTKNFTNYLAYFNNIFQN